MPGIRRRLWLVPAVIGLFAVVAVLVLWSATQTRAPGPSWRSFQMVFRHWGPFGINGTMAYRVAKIDYYHARHWRIETIEYTADPRFVGSWTEYFGDHQIRYSAPLDSLIESSFPTDDLPGVYVAENWLVPGRIAKVRSFAGVQVRDGEEPGTAVLTWTQILPCVNMALPGEEPYFPDCVGGQRIVVEEITYREDLEIPLHIIHRTNGRVTGEITVLEFRLL